MASGLSVFAKAIQRVCISCVGGLGILPKTDRTSVAWKPASKISLVSSGLSTRSELRG